MSTYAFWWFHRIQEALRHASPESRGRLVAALEALRENPYDPTGLVVHLARGRARSKVVGDIRLIAELPDGWRLTYSVGRLPPPLGGEVIKIESLLQVIEGDLG